MRFLIAATLTAGLFFIPQAPATAQTTYAGCRDGDPWINNYFYCRKADYVDSEGGKQRTLTLWTYEGQVQPKERRGTLYLYVQRDGDVYVQVCDRSADNIGVKLRVEWSNGTIFQYSDYNGASDGCETHLEGAADTPGKWKYVTTGTHNLRKWRATWSSYGTAWQEWPLHSF